MARMTREEMDRYDREMMGIMNPQAAMPATAPAPARAMTPTLESMDPMLRPEGTAGGPVVSYSLDDIRRFLGIGARPAMSPAEAANAAQMYERVPNRALPPTPPRDYDAPSPSIPYMPSTDPRGAAAPIPPPPLPVAPRGGVPVRPPAAPLSAAPARPAAALPVMQGLPTNEADFVPPRPDTLGGVSPADMNAGLNVMNRTLEDRRRFPMKDTVYFTSDPSRVYTYDELEEARRGSGTGIQRLNREQLVRALNTYGYNQLNPVQPFRRSGLFRPQQ